ncbi:MAG: hypothetical protein V1738_05700 [Patescibacteria group bacterium]
MTRTELDEPIDRTELKREILSEIRADKRRKNTHWLWWLLIAVLIILVVPFVLTMSLVAKSGLAHVPLLTSWLYEPVKPSRIVIPLSGANPEAVMTTIISRAEYNARYASVKLYLTETELTTIMNSAIANQDPKDLPLPISSVQTTIDDGSIEVYALITRDDGVQVPVLTRIVSEVQDGRLIMTSSELVLGSLVLPDFLANTIVRSLTKGLTEAINQIMSGGGTLEDIELTSGKATLLLLQK